MSIDALPELQHGEEHFLLPSPESLEAVANYLDGEHATFSYVRPSGIKIQVFVTIRRGPLFDATYADADGFPFSNRTGITAAELFSLWEPVEVKPYGT